MSQDVLIAQKAPYPVTVTAGETYYWCACGRSAQQPYCDGSHAGTGLNPLEFTAAETGTLYLCGCKRTANAPRCDGAHALP